MTLCKYYQSPPNKKDGVYITHKINRNGEKEEILAGPWSGTLVGWCHYTKNCNSNDECPIKKDVQSEQIERIMK